MENFFKIFTTLVPVLSVIVSSFVSYFIARNQVRNEIKKTQLSFEREDMKTFDNSFIDLMTKTEEYLRFNCNGNLYDSIESTAKLLTCAPKNFTTLIKEMDEALRCEDAIRIKCTRTKLFDLYSQEK